MTIKITPAIMICLALITIAPNARAEIASKAYVDDQDKLLIFGTTTPTEGALENVENGVLQYIKDRTSYAYTEASDALDRANQAYDRADDAYDYAERAMNHSFNLKTDVVGMDQTNSGLFVAKDGKTKIASGGVINDSLVSSTAAIQLGKLGFPTPGAECATRGCMLMFYNGQYVWEVVTRDTNETIATTGAVSATPTTGTTVTENVASNADY